MISFRYHLVSIIGIFLAIALGVVVGTSVLNGAVVGDLRRQVSDLKKSNSDSADANKALQAQAGNANLLAQTFGAKITANALAKTPVVLLAVPGAPKSLKDATAAAITAAGGSIAGRLQLTSNFDDPTRANDIRSLATSGSRPIGLQLPPTDDAGQLAGAMLGYVLLGHGQGTDLPQVLASFTTLNMIKAETASTAAGKAVVLVAPGGLAKGDAGAAMLLSFGTELATVGGPTVLAGDQQSASQNGLVELVRTTDSAKRVLSTVDDANSSLGALTVALTVADSIAGRKGNYGVASGADALMPGVSS